MKKKNENKELRQLKEIDKGVDSLNVWFIINTAATIITGLAAIILAILAYFRR